MRTISRYIIRQVWTPAALAAVLVTFVIVAAGLREQIGYLLEKVPFAQLRMADVAFVALFSMPAALGFILPITFMFGIMFAFGRLAVSSELTAMRACGISLKQAIAPVLGLGIVVSVACFFLQDVAQPWAMKRLSTLLTQDVPLRMTLDMLPTGVMHHYGDWRVYLGSRDDDGTLRDIMLLQPEEGGGVSAFYADSAHVESGPEGSRIVLRNGHLIPASKGSDVRRVAFEKLEKTIPRANPRAPLAERNAMTAGELFAQERQMLADYEQTRAIALIPELAKLRDALASRFALPLFAFALGIMAAPVGARTTRFGRSYAFAAGALLTVFYFALRSAVEPTSYLDLPLALAGAQIPNLVFLAAGLILMARVDRV